MTVPPQTTDHAGPPARGGRPGDAGSSTEEFGFGTGDAPLYVALHLPARPQGAVAICGSIGWEFTKSYRREVVLARALAAGGYAVVRYHPRGMGESGGSFATTTVATMVADARQACALLTARTGLPVSALVGVRVGALVAARLAEQGPGGPVVLWDAVVDGARYVRELVQVRRVWNMTRGSGPSAERDLDVDGSLEVLGYRLSANLLDQLRSLPLAGWLVRPPGPVLSLHVGSVPGAALGGPARFETVPGRIDWWLKRQVFESEEASPLTAALVSRTAGWLAARHVAGAGVGGAGRRPAGAVPFAPSADFGGLRREVVAAPAGNDTLAGIYVPARGVAKAGAVLLNCGSYHPTCGPLGLWARLADRLATRGVASVRLAYRGVADSSGAVDDFDLTQPRTVELAAARMLLRRRGMSRHLLIGACLGARTACAADLTDVVGLGLVSLPLHRESLATGVDSRADTAGAPPAWLNHALLAHLRRCADAGLAVRVIYGRDERYHRDLLAASATREGAVLRAGAATTVDLVDGADSMFATAEVIDAVERFVAEVLGSEGTGPAGGPVAPSDLTSG